MLLSGKLLFQGRTYEELFKQIRAGDKWDFSDPSWGVVSEQAKDLIRGMLQQDPHDRLTAIGVLGHPFIARHDSVADSLLSGSLHGLKKLKARARFKAVARVCIAGIRQLNKRAAKAGIQVQLAMANMTKEDLVRVKEGFTAEAGDRGALDREGFKKVMRRLGWATLPLDDVFDLFDKDKNGTVDHAELVTALMRIETQQEEDLTRKLVGLSCSVAGD